MTLGPGFIGAMAAGVLVTLGLLYAMNELAKDLQECREAPKMTVLCPQSEPLEHPEGFPVEDWVCVTTEEDFKLMMWASDIEEAAHVYEDIMGDQQNELEWWREHCVYEKALEHRNLEAAKRLRKWRKELRVKAAGRAVDEATGEKGP